MFKVACVGTWFLENKPFLSKVSPSFISDNVLPWAETNLSDHELIERLRNFKDQPKKPENDFIDTRVFKIFQWSFLLAALLHDVGYAYSFRKYFDSSTARLNDWLAITSFNSEPSLKAQGLFNASLVGEFFTQKLKEN